MLTAYRVFLPLFFCLTLGGSSALSEVRQTGAKLESPFFPFCIETHDSAKRSLREQADLAKELGFDGVGHLWLENVEERLETLDALGLKLFWIHTTVNLAPDKPAYDPALLEVLPLLKDRGVLLSLNIVGQPASDETADPAAVKIIREISDQAERYGVRLVLYHHINQWLERFEDSLRVVTKIDRANVGVMFNLCHWSAKGREEDLRSLLAEAMPHLYCIAINGMDRPIEVQEGTGERILPLDSGSFDVLGFLRMARELGFRGPIGLMVYGLKGDAREHLFRSMTAWRRMQQALRDR